MYNIIITRRRCSITVCTTSKRSILISGGIAIALSVISIQNGSHSVCVLASCFINKLEYFAKLHGHSS